MAGRIVEWWFVGARDSNLYPWSTGLVSVTGLFSSMRTVRWFLRVCQSGECRVYPPGAGDQGYKTYPDFETAQVALKLKGILK